MTEYKVLVEYEHEEIVYLKTDIERRPRLIIGWVVDTTCIMYTIMQGIERSTHYEFELTRDKSFITDKITVQGYARDKKESDTTKA